MKKIGIIGAGSMGRGIAQLISQHGDEVLMYDKFPNAINHCRDQLIATFNSLSEKGKISTEDAKAAIGRIYFGNSLSSFTDVECVIEAAIEQLDIKQNLFRECESIVSKDCILATNTSSLPVTAIASVCKYPERVGGLHFFNPAPLMKLVEVIPALQSSTKTLQILKDLASSWSKTVVIAKDTPGFIVNRIARPYYGESLRILEEGLATPAQIDDALTMEGGFRMGPFQLMDLIGNDVNYAVTKQVFDAMYSDPRYTPSIIQARLVDAGWYGKKSGKGYYDYVQSLVPVTPLDASIRASIKNRVLAMLINEAAEAVRLGIASPMDIETAMTLGTNYPKGLLAWCDAWGVANVVNQLDALFEEYHDMRYRCSPLLRRMARDCEKFF